MIETLIFWLYYKTILSEDGYVIKLKYYSFNNFLFLTWVLSLQDVFLWNMFYFVLEDKSSLEIFFVLFKKYI